MSTFSSPEPPNLNGIRFNPSSFTQNVALKEEGTHALVSFSESEESKSITKEQQVKKPLNILSFTFRKLCRERKVKKGTSTLNKFFESWTDENGFENLDLYPDMEVLNLDEGYLGSLQLMVLADILRVEKRDTVCAPTGALQMLKSMREPPSSFNVCLVPELRRISLRNLCFDFGIDDRKKFRAITKESIKQAQGVSTHPTPFPGSLISSSLRKSGNESIRYFLQAITGHPSLEVIDLSCSPIGPHLLPAMSRFIKGTPSLRKIELQNTLLSNEEVDLITAQCELNLLKREAEDPDRAAYLRKLWKFMEMDWLRGRSQKIKEEYFLEEEREKQTDVKAIWNDISHYFPKTVTAFVSVSKHIRTLDFPHDIRHSHPRENKEDSNLESSGTIVMRPYTQAGSSARPQSGSPKPDQTFSHLFNRPYMRYFTSNELVLSGMTAEAEEILKSAFVDPNFAEITFLRGLKPCPSLPSYSNQAFLEADTAKDANTFLALKKDMEESQLLRAVRRVLFPRPEKPPSLLSGIGSIDANMRSSAEENYLAVVERQDRQWNYLVDKLVTFMKPSKWNDGDIIFHENETPYWLWFLPHQSIDEDRPAGATEDRVKVQVTLSPSHVEPYSIENVSSDMFFETDEEIEARIQESMPSAIHIKEGEFFGDRELFGTTALYILQHSRHCGTGTLDLGGLRELYKARESDAQICVLQKSHAGDSPEHSPSLKVRGSAGCVKLWQLPLEVAFFLLFEPFQTFHLKAADAVQALPSTQLLHPSMAIMLGYMLQPSGFTFGELTERLLKDPKNGGVVATHDELLENTYIFGEGEYILQMNFEPGQGSEEQNLAGGSVVTNYVAYGSDMLSQDAQGITLGLEPRKEMGKMAAMREYREKKLQRRKNEKLGNQPRRSCSPKQRERNVHYTVCVNNNASHWRYYKIGNEGWCEIPEKVRLALCQGCIVIGDPASPPKTP